MIHVYCLILMISEVLAGLRLIIGFDYFINLVNISAGRELLITLRLAQVNKEHGIVAVTFRSSQV